MMIESKHTNLVSRKSVFVIVATLIILTTIISQFSLFDILEERAIQQYPHKSIEMIVSFKEGGGTDIGARLISEYLSIELGQAVIVRNIDGNDGEVGYAELAGAKPDGYTIGFINLPTFISLTSQRNTRYQIGSVVPIANYVLDPAVIVVRADSRWTDFGSWLEYCETNPLKMTVSNNGIAASNHIAAAKLEFYAHVQLTHVPFGGTSDMLRALEEGYVNASIAKISEVAHRVESGQFRILAAFTTERHAKLPDIPTLIEEGLPITMGSARAIAAPAGVHPEVIKKIHQAYLNAFSNPEHMREADSRRISLHYMSGEEVIEYMRSQESFLNEKLPRIGL